MLMFKDFFRNVCWGLFFYCFSFNINNINLYPFIKLIGCLILLYNLYLFINDNEYFLFAYKIMKAIFAILIIFLIINSCSFLYGYTLIPNYIITIINIVLFMYLQNNFISGIEKSTSLIFTDIKENIRFKIIIMMLILIIGDIFENDQLIQLVLAIVFLIIFISLTKNIKEIGTKLDELGYSIINKVREKQQILKLKFFTISAMVLFIMVVCMNFITVKKITLTNEKLDSYSHLAEYKAFNEILNELPDNELQYYNLPIKNIEIQETSKNEIKATTYMTEFITEDSSKMARFLIRVEWEEEIYFYGEDYITLNMDVNEIIADTVNIFYTDGEKIYTSDKNDKYTTKAVSHMLGSSVESGLLVPNIDGKYIYYVGVTQRAEADRLIFVNLVNYYHKKDIFQYPYKPLSENNSIDYDDKFTIYNTYKVKENK